MHSSHIPHPFWSYSLVIVQFGLIALLLTSGAWIAHQPSGWGWQVAAIVLGIWALQTMHLGHFNIIPDPRPDSSLVQGGPYRLIRHPMYASILLFFIPLVIQEPSPWRILLMSLLTLNLWLKLHYEERLLTQRFDDYTDYQARSKKIIPFIY